MNRRRLFAWSIAPLAVAAALLSAGTEAAPAAKGSAPSAQAATVSSLVPMLDGFHWGMSPDEVIKAHNQVQGIFDRDYNPILMKLQPGIQMKSVEAERENKKITFQHSLLKFDNTPVGYDTTGLHGEYSYRNKESAQVVERDGKRRFFFYIGDLPNARLWKIYDEVPVGGSLGASYQDAVQKLAAQVGKQGVAIKESPERGLPLPFMGWQDATTQLRVMDRSNERVIGVVVEDKALLSALPQLRSHKEDDPLAMDPAITAVTNGGVTDPSAHRAAAADAGAAPKGSKKR